MPSGSSYGQNEKLEWFGITFLFSNDQRGKKVLDFTQGKTEEDH